MGVQITEGWPTSLKKQGVLFLTLQIHDPEVDNYDNPDEEENDGEAAEDMDVEFDVEEEPGFPFGWPHFQYNCTGLSGGDFMSDMKLRLGFYPDEEGGSNRASLLNRLKQDRL